jgi:hypothetical protein
MQSNRRPHVVSTRLTETDSQTLQQWCDSAMRCPGDLLNTVLSRVFELRREHRSARSLEGFVQRLELKALVRSRGSKKPEANDGQIPLWKRAHRALPRAIRKKRTK